MTNLEKANQIVVELLKESKWYFQNIKPRIVNWIPQLAYSENYGENKDSFLYYIEWEKKFFIEIRIYEEWSISGSKPRFKLSSWYDDIIDSYLNKYPPYISPNKSLSNFINNDLPNLRDHERDKRIFITCYTDSWQWNIGHLWMDHEFLTTIANSWLQINYAIELQ